MANDYSSIPSNAKGTFEPFKIHIEEQKVQDLKQLIKLSPVVKDSYENQEARVKEGQNLGITREWLLKAKAYWENEFDWREHESYLNSFPNFKAPIQDDDGRTYNIHFVALFSSNPSAIPIARLNGWPSTFAEALPVLDLLRKKYTPADLPYHIIIPAQPGWTFSDSPPLDKDWTGVDSARILHKLMLALGFGNGYVVSGGDIGAALARLLAATYAECKALHLNYCQMFPVDDCNREELENFDKEGLKRYDQFNITGNAYGRMHGTRPATIGAVLSSSPLALLAWTGEKYLEWSDNREPLSIPTILGEVSLFWLCESAPTSIYTYREDFKKGERPKGYFHGQEKLYVDKPLGYSYFPYELAPIPEAWVKKTGRLEWYRRHQSGGHFPSLERPAVLLGDVEDFVKKVWKRE